MQADRGGHLEEEQYQALLQVTASSTGVDQHGTEMTERALIGMAQQMNNGVVYLPSHGEYEWDDVIGKTLEASIEQGRVLMDGATGTQGDGKVLRVVVGLYAENERASKLARVVRLAQHSVGTSIGGWFTDMEFVVNSEDEVERVLIHGVELDHLATTRRPSNRESWIDGLMERATAALSTRSATLENPGAEDQEQRDEHMVDVDGKSCPLATQDAGVNLANRQYAIEEAGYGPANPEEDNEDFWSKKAEAWDVDVSQARTMLCGNCSAFDLRNDTIACIEAGIGGDSPEDVQQAGELGFCKFFKFKCSAKRTCSAWVVGGPLTDEAPEGNDERTVSTIEKPALDSCSVAGEDQNDRTDALQRAEPTTPKHGASAMDERTTTSNTDERLDALARSQAQLAEQLGGLVALLTAQAQERASVQTPEPTLDFTQSHLERENAELKAKLQRTMSAAGRAGIGATLRQRVERAGGFKGMVVRANANMPETSAVRMVCEAQAERRDATIHATPSRSELESDLRSLLTAAMADGIIIDPDASSWS